MFSFSAIIISTVFLSGMTNLLTAQVRYPEINSLSEFGSADIFLQIPDVRTSSDFLLQNKENYGLATKMTYSFRSMVQSVNIEIEDGGKMILASYLSIKHGENYTRRIDTDEYIRKQFENTHAISETDAFLLSIPQALRSRSSIHLDYFLLEKGSNYHLVEECFITYPVLIPFLKNSFIFEKMNCILVRFLEAGLIESSLKSMINVDFNPIDLTSDDKQPKPFDLNDLQPAFIFLIIGLFLSFLIFVAEISEVFKNYTFWGCFMHMKTYIFR